MAAVVNPSSIFMTQTTNSSHTADTAAMETKMLDELRISSGTSNSGSGVETTGGDTNHSNGKTVAVLPVQQSHASSSAASCSSSAWSLRSKNELGRNNISPESNNSSQKSYQFCRICHEGGDSGNCTGISLNSSQGSSASRREPLIAPCRCTGSVAMVHLSCLEHWLTTSNSEKCELCNFIYKTKKMPRSWTEAVVLFFVCFKFLTESDNQFNVRNMIADLICFFLLTPLLVISTYLCCLGAHQYYIRERWEAMGLVTLSIFLLAVYFTWCHVTLKYHVGVWRTWARTHQRVQIAFSNGSFGEFCQRTPPEPPARVSASITTAVEGRARSFQRTNANNISDSTGSSFAATNSDERQFEYVNILEEEEDDYFGYRRRSDSTENLYIVNPNNSYNHLLPYGFNRQQGGDASGHVISGSNVFTYHPVIVIPTTRRPHSQLNNIMNTESNFPVMGLSSFTGGRMNANNSSSNNNNNSNSNNAAE